MEASADFRKQQVAMLRRQVQRERDIRRLARQVRSECARSDAELLKFIEWANARIASSSMNSST